VTRTPGVLLTANLFGIPFGFAGVAQCWSTAHDLELAPAWPSQVLWVVTAVVYVVLLVAYVGNVVSTGRAGTEVSDQTFGPFTALILILPMLLALDLARYAPQAGTTIFLVLVVLIALYGGWVSGQWIIADMPLDRWHPGYFLPTVAGPLLAAAGCAARDLDGPARLLLGYGLICWVTLNSIILLRLFTCAPLPSALVPSLAIEVAPPVVAGSAWFAINGGRPDTMAYLLAGYALLMVLVQIRLIPLYLRVPFKAGGWAYSFSYAAALSVGIRWLVAEQVDGRQALTYCLLGVISLALTALAVRTAVGLGRGTFLPPRPAQPTVQASMTTALDGLEQHNSTISSDGGSRGVGS
jgi:tellurite resistance protein